MTSRLDGNADDIFDQEALRRRSSSSTAPSLQLPGRTVEWLFWILLISLVGAMCMIRAIPYTSTVELTGYVRTSSTDERTVFFAAAQNPILARSRESQIGADQCELVGSDSRCTVLSVHRDEFGLAITVHVDRLDSLTKCQAQSAALTLRFQEKTSLAGVLLPR